MPDQRKAVSVYSETDKHLPPGWHKHTDAEGVAYYTNDTTGETQWTPPKGSAEEALTRSRVVTRQEESPWSENYDSATSKSCECPPLCTCRRAHNSPCPNDPTRPSLISIHCWRAQITSTR